MPKNFILDVAESASRQGTHSIEIAGGDPLLYPDLENLIIELRQIKEIRNIYLTTTGILLPQRLDSLKKAGIDGINIHLDSINAPDLTEITGASAVLNQILQGIWYGVSNEIPLTISAAVQDISLRQLATLASLARKLPVVIRLCCIAGISDGIDPVELAGDLAKRFGTAEENENGFRPEGWKGYYRFGQDINGAFGMEQAIELSI